jgi:hypothetical protein
MGAANNAERAAAVGSSSSMEKLNFIKFHNIKPKNLQNETTNP